MRLVVKKSTLKSSTQMRWKMPSYLSVRTQQVLQSNLNFSLVELLVGKMIVEEIGEDFTQDDLISDDVMILDGGNLLYVWIGNGANAEERKHAPE